MASDVHVPPPDSGPAAGRTRVLDAAAVARLGHVFVSFASQDQALADRVVAYVEAAGLRCWIAHRDIKPAESYPSALSAAVSSCSALVLVLTASSGDSRHVLREIEMAFNAGKPILSIRLGGVPLSPNLEYFLSTTQWLDAGADLDDEDLDRVRGRLRELLAAGPVPGGRAPAGRTTGTLYGSSRFWLPVLAFHGISLLMASTELVDYLAPASYGMSFATGVVVVALTRHCNIPVLFTVAFLQPILIYLPDVLSVPPEVLRALPVGLPVWIGALCAGGGALMALRQGRLDAGVLSLAGWRAWMAPTWNLLRRSEKLETVVKAIVVLAAVLGWLFRFF